MPQTPLNYSFNLYIIEKVFILGNFVGISGYKTNQNDPKYQLELKIMVEKAPVLTAKC